MDDKRMAIIKAASQLMEKGGAVTIDQIAQEAGVAKGTVYLYFNSKQDLFRQTVLVGLNELDQALGAAAHAQPGGSIERLAAMLFAHYKHVSRQLLLIHRFMTDEPDLMQGMEKDLKLDVFESINRIQNRYAEELKIGIQTGEYRPHQPDIVAAALMAMIHNLTVGCQLFHKNLDERLIVPEILQLVRSGLAASPAAGAVSHKISNRSRED